MEQTPKSMLNNKDEKDTVAVMDKQPDETQPESAAEKEKPFLRKSVTIRFGSC